MFFVAFPCCAIPARADPIRVTSGFVEGAGPLGGLWDSDDLVLAGAGFSISEALEDINAFVQLATVPTVEPGVLVDWSGVFHFEAAISTLLNKSTVFVGPFKIAFHASPTPLACSSTPMPGEAGGLKECTGVAPFTADADLTFTPFGGVPFTRHVIGGGTAEGRLVRGRFGERGSVRYSFEASPTPEPATLALVTTGAMMAGAGLWRRRRGGRRSVIDSAKACRRGSVRAPARS
jgi:hypothetical protein